MRPWQQGPGLCLTPAISGLGKKPESLCKSGATNRARAERAAELSRNPWLTHQEHRCVVPSSVASFLLPHSSAIWALGFPAESPMCLVSTCVKAFTLVNIDLVLSSTSFLLSPKASYTRGPTAQKVAQYSQHDSCWGEGGLGHCRRRQNADPVVSND